MSDTVIQIANLSKKYRLGTIGGKRLADDLNRQWAKFRGKPDPLSKVVGMRPAKAKPGNGHLPDEIWALKDVSLEVKQGEVLGIIGRNGAGKSTLLKILSRVTAPTSGEVRVKGRIASLLEVGTGFHPELTGRENIFLNGAILGMTKAEIRKKFDEIVDFSEVEQFIDTPVKRYSSGMYVRLAFAVAAHLDPEILIVDEVLAVGDVAFQKKCLGKMGDVARGGRTVLFVSHNMGAMNSLTQQCAYLEDGQIAASGPTHQIVDEYLMRQLRSSRIRDHHVDNYRRNPDQDTPVRIVGLSLSGHEEELLELPVLRMGEKITILVDLDVEQTLHGALLDITLKSSNGERVAMFFSLDKEFSLILGPGHHRISAEIRNLTLSPGNYFVDVGINKSVETKAFDVILDFPLFEVANKAQVTHWINRPWGTLHGDNVEWSALKSKC